MKNRNSHLIKGSGEQEGDTFLAPVATAASASTCSRRWAKISSYLATMLAVTAFLTLTSCSLPDFFRSANNSRLGDGGYQGFLSGSVDDAAGGHAKTAIVMAATGDDAAAARAGLDASDGVLARVLERAGGA